MPYLATRLSLSPAPLSSHHWLGHPYLPIYFTLPWILFNAGTSIIYAKCSSSNDDRSPSHHHSTDGEEMLQVERILGRRWNTRSRQIEFLTVWRGFDEPSEYTWEPESNFSIRSLAIFKQMWGKANEPPLDGKEEMLSKRDIEKLKELESSRGTKAASSTHGSTEASSSTVSSSSPSSSVRRSTRIRTTTVLELTEPGDGGGKMDEVGSMNAKSSLSSDWSNASRNTSGVVWTPVNECILLLTALEHPEDLVSNGPGEFRHIDNHHAYRFFFFFS